MLSRDSRLTDRRNTMPKVHPNDSSSLQRLTTSKQDLPSRYLLSFEKFWRKSRPAFVAERTCQLVFAGGLAYWFHRVLPTDHALLTYCPSS